MLTKCNYLDKLHLCTSQDRWPNSGMSWTDQLTEAILICIPEDTKLRDLFIRWCMLSPGDRESVDENIITRERFDLYIPLKRAMKHWELVQDTQGAPGFDNGLFAFTCDTHLDEELTNLVTRVDNVIDRAFEGNIYTEIKRQIVEKAVDLLHDQSSSKLKQEGLKQ